MLVGLLLGLCISCAIVFYYLKSSSLHALLMLRQLSEMRGVQVEDSIIRLQDLYLETLDTYFNRYGSAPINRDEELARAHYIKYIIMRDWVGSKSNSEDEEHQKALLYLRKIFDGTEPSETQIRAMFGLEQLSKVKENNKSTEK